MTETYLILQQFCESCDWEQVKAEVIRDAYLQGRITLEEANLVSNENGIAGPLAYWNIGQGVFDGSISPPETT